MSERAWLTAVLLSASIGAQAAPLKREEVPAPLQPWIAWVLRGHEAERCSAFNARGDRVCAWPGALALALSDAGGTFSQAWRAEAEDWALLPGGSEHWPQDVRVDGAAVPVVARGGFPAVFLKPGAHQVSGAFRWSRLPEQLELPATTGLLALTVGGKPAPFPLRDESGRLWLQAPARATPTREESRLAISVHRRLVDEVPVQIVTRLQLKISGPNRELVLGRPLPDGFAPMSLVSSLPARLDADGRLRVQARSGAWDLVVTARREGAGDEIKLPAPGGPWAADEAWVFDARPALRQADVEGVPALDPQQTELPADWKRLPAYLVKAGGTVRVAQRRRGDDPPSPDRLTLTRELWLDFDGGGFTARDELSGTLGRSWRLEASPETRLGRVSAGGADQFLTALSSGGPAGLEVRARRIDVEADSRVEGRRLTASGWNHDFESVSAVVHLPPGWRALAARGADDASPTWISDWTLLDFFLVLVAAAAFARLFGRGWGAAALAGLALSWHEASAPRWLWLAVLLLAALDRVLTGYPSFARWVGYARRAVWLVLLLVAFPFLVSQVRTGVFPVLEEPYDSVQPRADGVAGKQAEAVRRRHAAARRGEDGGRELNLAAGGAMDMISGAAQASVEAEVEEPKAAPAAPPPAQSSFYSMVLSQMRLDPSARVNTGPGLPYWRRHGLDLTWRGPVPHGQPLRLWLVPPCLNLLLALARVALTVLLALLVGGLPVGEWLESLRGPEGRARLARALLPVVLLAALAPLARAADGTFPPRDLLDELRGRLLERPACWPSCAESPRLRLKATSERLSLTLDVHAAAATAVPVPAGGREWSPAKGTLDGTPAPVLRGPDGGLWVPVPAGAHVLVLEGPLPARDAVQLSLPLKPRRVEASVSGWTLQGLRDDGRSDDNLQLSRARGAEPAAAAAARAQGIYPPFLRVERAVRLGLSWSVETRVERLTPLGAPVVVSIPLLPGESVTTQDLRVVDGKVQLNLGPQSPVAGWSSVLAESKSLVLAAPKSVPWSESWRVEPGPLWHVAASGLPAVYEDPSAGARALAYRPWPGESLALAISRPGAVVGRTLTVDQSVLTLSPGVRATDATLALSLRTSRGERQTLTLPEGAELLAAKVDGQAQPLRLEGRALAFAVPPGAHEVEADWRQSGGARLFFRAPEVGLGAPSVNSHVVFAMPAGRWVLLVGGRGLGPVVLFWSLLAVFALASVGLSKTGLAPLSWRQWFLLSLGLTQLSVVGAAIVAGWFLVVGLRGTRPPQGRREFNLAQVFVAFYTAAAAAFLFQAISRGLLGAPDMQIAGNGSDAGVLRWYLDRAGAATPRPWALSAPVAVYRAAMLVWALWLANALIGWARWGWERFSAGGFWRSAD